MFSQGNTRKRVSHQDIKVVVLKPLKLHCPDKAAHVIFTDISLLFISFPLVLRLNGFKSHRLPRNICEKATRLKLGRGLSSLWSGALHTCGDLEPVDTAVYPICFCAGIVQAFACLSTWRLTARYRADGPLIFVGEFVFPSLCKPCEQFYSCRVCFLFSMRTNHSHRHIDCMTRTCDLPHTN